jgi:hypothetical protein
MDELLGEAVGVFTSDRFWRDHVVCDAGARARWSADGDVIGSGPAMEDGLCGVRVRAADRGGPGWHHVLGATLGQYSVRPVHGPQLVARRPGEPHDLWRARWTRSSAVAELQRRLNEFGADLIVDGAYGPATAAAMRACTLLHRRDGLESAWLADVTGARRDTDRKVST